MNFLDPLLKRHLEGLKRLHRFRSLRAGAPAAPGRVARDGRELLDFSSNDYLGLARHPKLVEAARHAAARWGTGAGASRLVTGTSELHEAIEVKLARLKGTEAALIFPSGFQTNATVIPALLRRDLLEAEPLVFADALMHASMHQGCRAAGVKPILFRHNDLGHLETLLAEQAARPAARFILAESLYSMDGDCADVPALATLAERYGAFLYLDEAHATGVLGPNGMGLAGTAPGRVPLIMGTFSKALGSSGAFVACSNALRDYLVNRCAGFVYSTALAPPALGAVEAALDLAPQLGAARAHLMKQATRLRAAFQSLGLDTGRSASQIVPALLGAEETALALSASLEARGMLAVAIRPPTVPPGTSRLRFSLSAAHSAADIDRLIEAAAALTPRPRAALGG
ncbi:MAG TPA: pyridoxal phosphate-dependent aminotransferase family protein [Alphaproteobacteria bacterium]|nr:pyridoxal phosphate-dependent aminotransferase family protein [Alphaproteobacteria bacterium]